MTYFQALLDEFVDDALLHVVALQGEEGHDEINEMFVNDPGFPEPTCKSKRGDRFYLQSVSGPWNSKSCLV